MSASRERPPPSLDGELRFDDQARTAAAEDFGRLVHQPPEGVLLPASEEDVAATIRWVAERGRRFAAQGNRHSVFGHAQARDGIVADLRRLRAVHDLRDDRVLVDAGATASCWPAWPTTGPWPSRAPCPTSTTWTGWPRSSRRCGPTASGGARIRG